MIFNQIISEIAAAKGADKVCADLLGSFPQMKIPTWTAANNPAMGIKEGMKYPAITWTQPALEMVELNPYWMSLGLNTGNEKM